MAEPVRTFVGFYWTLPVPGVGFTRLPDNAADAAACSQTIHYQRELVGRYVSREGQGQLVGEVVWLELAPDRGSEHVEAALRQALILCRVHGATLVYVDFSQRSGWRAHHHLRHRLEQADVPCRALDPDPLDGDDFDPIRHFERWRGEAERRRASQPRGKALWQIILPLIAPYLPPRSNPPDYQSAAALLEESGIRTATGRPWTPDNLRMFVHKARSDAWDIEQMR